MDPDGAEFAFLLKFFNHGKSENPRYFRRLSFNAYLVFSKPA